MVFKKIYDSLFKIYRLSDISIYDIEKTKHLPIYGVYHIFMDTGWENVVKKQIKDLNASGLFNASEKIYISCIAKDKNEIRKLTKIINNDKAEIIFYGNNPKEYEYPALKFIKKKSYEGDFLFYYFHTKGITYQAFDCNDKMFINFKQKIISWCDMLTYSNFYKWRVAINVLSSDYETYGCYLWPPKMPCMYSGSFWWAKSQYIRKLPDFDDKKIKEDRFYSETWLFKKNAKHFSAFDTKADLYFVDIPRSIYANVSPPLHDRITFSISYNWWKILKHFFHYNYKKRCQQRLQKLKNNI